MARHDTARCRKILAIRARAGQTVDVCPSCTRPAATPYHKKNDRGRVTEGCVDAHHSTAHHLTDYAVWYWRPDAQAIRAEVLMTLVGY